MSKTSTFISEIFSTAERDYTKGSVAKAVILLSVPMILEMALESVFAIVDAYYVGRLGSPALAAVGITEAVVNLIFSVAMGISLGTTALVARRIGEKNPYLAGRVAAQSIWLGVIVSLPISIISILFPEWILEAMGADESVVLVGSGFTAILLGGNLSIMLLFILNAVFRGAGDAVIAMRVLWLANLINIVLDPLLIFGIGPFPEMGVTGAAVATTIGRGSGVVFQLYILFNRKSRINVSRENLKPDISLLWHLVKVSMGGVFQFLIATASWIGLVRILAIFGSAALAGYTIAIRIIIFSILPSWGLSNATATLVGQNLGAKKPERAERSVWIGGFSNFIFLMLVAAVFLTIPEKLVSIFANDRETIKVGVNALRIISYGYGFYAFGMVMIQAFNGAGDTMTPTKINFFIYWLFQIPLAFVLSKFLNYGPNGVFWAITIAEIALSITGVIVFKIGKWKEKVV